MKITVPDYYKDFKCIADRCRHTCCAHWEIDVDEESLERYRGVKGDFGRRLMENIEEGEDCPHFRLCDDERCPFLNKDNLCDIYINLGEEALCQICTDHPRFRNFFYDRTETGLGLCCEAAAQLILGKEDKMRLVTLSDDGEREEYDPLHDKITAVRDRAFEILQDRTMPLEERRKVLEDSFGLVMPSMTFGDWAEMMGDFEILDSQWERCLEAMKHYSAQDMHMARRFETSFEQLAVYFVFRHLPAAQSVTDVRAILCFALWSFDIIECICNMKAQQGECSFEDLAEAARLFSSEIEYSDDNTYEIQEVLWEENDFYEE